MSRHRPRSIVLLGRRHQERVRNLAWAVGEVHQDHPCHLDDIPITGGPSWPLARICVILQPCAANRGLLSRHRRLLGRMLRGNGLSRECSINAALRQCSICLGPEANPIANYGASSRRAAPAAIVDLSARCCDGAPAPKRPSVLRNSVVGSGISAVKWPNDRWTIASGAATSPHPARIRVCSVISGGQLKRTGTTETPAPADV
jgi:hypothetical protein